ncbi:HK97 family phage prohead protease [Terrarubrum flagellatum]|uniref:HK97 family phage prohead protease n=1 Tax=Terrirubrum flagellatum TaxID=2895980 RepID=UPI0031452305
MTRAPDNRTAPEFKPLRHGFRTSGDDGLIEGYASLFGEIDMSNDLVEAGAFRDSLKKRGPDGVRMLWQHDAKEPIGAWLSIAEDGRGLFVRGRLDPGVQRAQEVFSLIANGAVDGLSIGFKAERATKDARGGSRRLTKIDLWEISIVTFPMLNGARVSAVAHDASSSQGEAALAAKIRRAAALFNTARRPL